VSFDLEFNLIFSLDLSADLCNRLLVGAVYWYVWSILLPKWYGYRLENHTEVLKDGTSVTKIVHVPLPSADREGP
jgi:hypothetical protein